MKQSFWTYLKAAFNARPIGMFVPPNWIALAAVALVGALVHPGFLLIGAGAELAYLLALASNARFQRLVNGKALMRERQQWQALLQRSLSQLDPEGRQRYWKLHRRCEQIIDQQRSASAMAGEAGDSSPELEMQGQGLARLLWIYLRLLRTRQAIERIVRESIDLERSHEPLEQRVGRLQAKIEQDGLDDELRKSLQAQLEIVRQRLEQRGESREKIAYLDAELSRVEQQVELIREQAVVASEPSALSERIDQIAATLGGTQQWMRDQQSLLGTMDDMLVDPPPMAIGAASETE